MNKVLFYDASAFCEFSKYNEKMLCSVQIIDDYFYQELPLRKVFLC